MCTIGKTINKKIVNGYKLSIKHDGKYYSPLALTLIEEGEIQTTKNSTKLPFLKYKNFYDYDRKLKGFSSMFKNLKDAKNGNWFEISFYGENKGTKMLYENLFKKSEFVILKVKGEGLIKETVFGSADGFVTSKINSFKEICKAKNINIKFYDNEGDLIKQ